MSVSGRPKRELLPLVCLRGRGPQKGVIMAQRGQGRAYGLLRDAASWARACPRSGDIPFGRKARSAKGAVNGQ
jgi:hypothetical protein